MSHAATSTLPRDRAGGAANHGTVLAIIGAVIVWELAARGLQGAYLLAGPSAVVLHLMENAGLMARALRVTLQNAALGFLIGNFAAILLALLALVLPRLERPVSALALLVFCLPLVATGPILRVLYGPGNGPQITIAALAVYYTTFVPLLVGLRAAPATWFEVIRSYGRGRVTELVQVRAFAALPYLVAGLQIAAPAAFLGAMVGEFTGAERGMGVLAIQAMRNLDVAATWALATVASAVAIVAYAVIGRLGRWMVPDPPPMILAPLPDRSPAPLWQGVAVRAASMIVVAAVVVLLWAGMMEAFGLNRFFAKRPTDVWAFLVSAADAAAHRATLLQAMGETLAFTVPGYLAGLALGAGAAALMVLFPTVAAAGMPIAIALRSVPIVTTAPLVILLLGRGSTGTITLVAIMIFFPTLVACLQGLRQAPGQVMEVFDSYAAGRLQRLAFAQIPAMLPAFFAAARMAVPAAILAVTVVEWLATGAGIGSLMALSASVSDYGMLWSAIVVVSLVAMAGYAGVEAVGRAVLRVYSSEQLS